MERDVTSAGGPGFRIAGRTSVVFSCAVLDRKSVSRDVFVVDPETSVHVTSSSLPACFRLDGPPRLQDDGHTQPDAPSGEAQTDPQICGGHVRPPPAEGSGAQDYDPKAQEAQLCQQEVCSSAAVQRERSGRLHPRGGTQPAGAQRGAGAGRKDSGPARS
ncbi:hypothetical protein Q5P01_011830 [Channa striata]|uniref:Uncharacterized protein n=1 Tax=Channa striata TaxID=64152 RepID=A0AA88SPM2_CHASR|nr:hypothetical protein Q5P01_011830 [Channa striata]